MKKTIIQLLAITFLLGSCVQTEVNFNDLDLAKTSHKYKIVVQTYITTEYGYQYIRLTRPADYATGSPLKPVDGATVTVTCDDSVYSFSETADSGIYRSNRKFAAIVGKVYKLDILIGNEHYTAQDSVIAASEIDFDDCPLPQVAENVSGGGVIYFYLYRHNFGFSENAMWLWLNQQIPMEEYGTPFSEDLPYIYSHIGAEPQGLFPGTIFQYSIFGSQTDTFIVRKYSISDDYYNYLMALFAETEWRSSIFASVPGNLPTNISEGGTGYFAVQDVKIAKIAVADLLK